MVQCLLFALAPLLLHSAQNDRVEKWSEDLFALSDSLEQLHPNPYHGSSREDFEEAVGEIFEALPDLTDDQVIVELMRLFGTLAASGKEGHSGVFPGSIFGFVPLQLYRFDDGWFVVDSAEAHDDLVGAQVTALGGTGIEDVVRAVAPLVATDNSINMIGKIPGFLLMPRLLLALGLSPDRDSINLSLTLPDGKQVERRIASGPSQRLSLRPPTDVNMLWLSDSSSAWWLKVLDDKRTLYVQYNLTRARAPSGETLADFASTITGTFDAHSLERLVLDVRLNGGGDNTTFHPLVNALKQHATINRPGSLYALTGRATFSAAGNFVTALEQETDVILMGEPTGGGPNQFGDARNVQLPNHPDLFIRVATRYHEFDSLAPNRLTHEPHVSVGLTSREFFAGVDPVLERALTHTP